VKGRFRDVQRRIISIPLYDYFVGARIPEIIEGRGKKCRWSTARGEDLLKGLEKKLWEEVEEFSASGRSLEELADVLEVVDALACSLGSSFQEVLKLKAAKRAQRGGFQEGILLEWVED